MADGNRRERFTDECARLADECEELARQARRRGNKTAEQVILNAAANLYDAGAMTKPNR